MQLSQELVNQVLNINVQAVLADAAGDAITGVADKSFSPKATLVANDIVTGETETPEQLMQRAFEAMKVKQAQEADHAALDRVEVENIIAEWVSINGVGPKQTVVVRDAAKVKVDVGVQHKQFPKLLDMAAQRLCIMIPGPAGSGKSHAARSVAQALDLPFYAHGAMEMRHELLGHVNQVTNEYVSQPFVEAYRNGGVVMLDEVDSWDSNATLALNGAIADRFVFLPNGERVDIHSDCIIMAGANTLGQGADSRYVGRNKLDAAFLNRFVFLPWEYDFDLEVAICGNKTVAKKVVELRRKAEEYGLDAVISPRDSINAAKLVAAGWTLDEAIEVTTLNKLPRDQWDIFGY